MSKKFGFHGRKAKKRPKIVGVFGIENFLSILHFGWKIFKLEKTTFLDELGNFKHFEPYFIFCHCLLNSLSHSLLNSIQQCWKRCWRQGAINRPFLVLPKERRYKWGRVPFSAWIQSESKVKPQAADTLSLILQNIFELTYPFFPDFIKHKPIISEEWATYYHSTYNNTLQK